MIETTTPPYVHQSYPKWIYHQTEPAQIVADQAAHLKVGPGWHESPGEASSEIAEQAELYATPMAKIVEKLADSSKAMLEKVLAYEQANPKGGRKGLIAFITVALKAIGE